MADKEKATPVTPDEIDDIRVTLDLDEGEVECKILTIFDVNEQDYIALMALIRMKAPFISTAMRRMRMAFHRSTASRMTTSTKPLLTASMKCSMMTTSMHSKTKSNFFKPASNTRCRFFTALYRLL